MLIVFVTCPKTGRPINTGVSMARDEFEMDKTAPHQVTCPHCGDVHTWTKNDARLKNM